MAEKKVTKRRPKRKSKRVTKTNKNNKLVGSLSGILIILLTLTGMFQLGIIGTFILGIYKILVGQSYLLLMAIVILYSIGLTIYNQMVHFRKNWVWGVLVFYLGLLLLLHAQMFGELNQHNHFLMITWNNVGQSIVNSDTTMPIGGGMIGALLYSGAELLVGQVGAMVLSWILMLAGITIFFKIPWHSILLSAQRGLSILATKIKNRQKAVHSKRNIGNIGDVPVTSDKKPAIKNNVNETLNGDKNKPTQQVEPKITVATQPTVSDSAVKQAQPNKPSNADKNKDESSQPIGDFADTDIEDDKNYQLPPTSLLTKVNATDQSEDLNSIKENTDKLQSTLKSFGVDATIENVNLGPSVTKYELRPAVGVKVSRITHLADDLALALAAKDIRIEAPIPGKSLIGIEVPNKKVATVGFRNMVESAPKHLEKPLEVPLGRTVTGDIMTADLTKMPHLLIAGATGSGKSVAINVIITSILLKAKPHQVKFLMIDPKKVELSVYNGIPHLLSPVVSDPKKAARSLAKVVAEMERRYELFASFGIRNINGYNEQLKEHHGSDDNYPYLPLILVVVDELADLMMTVSKEVEDSIVRIAQMGRAAGIHMILATQRPSVDVITGLIKANVPSRIAFAVSSGVDSRTIIDTNGAEKLLGRGDMLFEPIDQNKPTRVQGAFISDRDVENVVKFIKDEQPANYDEKMMISDEEIKQEEDNEEQDELFPEALEFVVDQQKASTSLIQRRFRIGYNRAARIIDDMEQRGYIGPANGSKPREVYKQKDDSSN
ncbi:MAG: DNA translocase FtsK [Lactobacillus sp.]|uniref:FtsK/SpoIIIE family DNA translocase n=1 Tax=Limosilactobacillus coleohominis TaxID=181675 RepID=UPI002A908FED|nr:DNA translocase FtsK [Limosilactobacillus coleohominis]MCI5812740.1 DNA translocase FtsK [Lactobacillus sp.]MDY5629347.1 DNA translocase FtsK [Limosilactobacillus coleohominis]